MNKFLVPVLLMGTLSGFAQKGGKPGAFAKTISPQDLKNRLAIVAGASMEGRETATEGQRKAAAYIEGQFRQMGLEPGNKGSYQMPYDVFQDSVISETMEVNGKSYVADRDFSASPQNIEATLKFSELLLVGARASDSIRNQNLNGRLVMLIGNLPQGRGQGGGIYATLVSKGVSAILVVSPNLNPSMPASRKAQMTLNSYRRSITPQIFTISENMARLIAGDGYEQWKGNSAVVQNISANVLLDIKKTTLPLQSTDVIGVLPGTDLKDQYLFVTAHYDHLGKRGDSVIYYGADDDGSGTVSVLEIAEAFTKAKAEGKGPRRTVVFMTVSGEEKGLWGSDYYTSHPVFPLDKTTADLNIDMIGRTDSSRKTGDSSNYVYVVGDDKLSSDLRTISEGVNKKYLKLELDYKFNAASDPNRIYYRSDHYNFAKRGVPIIFYYDGMLGADYHKPTDTPDKINYPLLAKRAQLVFYTAWEMANRDQMLKRDIPLDNNVFNRAF